MLKYGLEFILQVQNALPQTIKNSIIEFGDNLEIKQVERAGVIRGQMFKINLDTEDPTLVFDACAQFGRIKSVKINELEER